MKPLLIIAASPFGRLVEALAEDAGMTVAGFIDDVHQGPNVLGPREALGARFSPRDYAVALAIGYSHLPARLRIYQECIAKGFEFPLLAHPRSHINPRARVADGCIVMAGANVDAFAHIEPVCVLWPAAVVSHDCVVGTNTFISPNATLCGSVEVGHSTFIGAGSVLVNGTCLPDEAFVKAGIRVTGGRSRA